MAVARARLIADLLQVHVEDLAFLWGQRREALGSRKHTLREYGELNERIEAHLQGLLVAEPAVLAGWLLPQLNGGDRNELFAAAYALLRLAEPTATHAVVVEFSRATGPALAGLRDALSLAPCALFGGEMQSALDQAKPITAVSAAVVLANHRLLDGQSPRLARLLEDDDLVVCELAWRAATVADAVAPLTAPKRPFNHALGHAAPAVRSAGWAAAAWAGQARAMPLLRQFAASGEVPALHWLAVLGGPEDVPLLQKAALNMSDGAARCALLARFGHPSALNALLLWMSDDDSMLAVAAGEAFTRITGVEVRGERKALPVAEDADEFAREMAPEVWFPDVPKARALMERHGAKWAAGTRWCNGLRLDGEVSLEQLAQLDLEARWDVAARAALAGRPVSAPAPIH
ncbi:MAG: hypothetical protein ABI671_07505 [Burkholderiales bacterium]